MHSTPSFAVPFAKHKMSSLHIFHWQQSSRHKADADTQQWKSIVARLLCSNNQVLLSFLWPPMYTHRAIKSGCQ